MVLIGLEVSFLIFDAQSLKDKRSVMKSMMSRMRRKYNISIAEIDQNDIINNGVIGIGVVGNDRTFCRQILQSVMKDIEEQYEIEILNVQEIEG